MTELFPAPFRPVMKLTLFGSRVRSRLAWFMKSFSSMPRIWK